MNNFEKFEINLLKNYTFNESNLNKFGIEFSLNDNTQIISVDNYYNSDVIVKFFDKEGTVFLEIKNNCINTYEFLKDYVKVFYLVSFFYDRLWLLDSKYSFIEFNLIKELSVMSESDIINYMNTLLK